MDVSVKLLELQAHKLWKKDKKTVVFSIFELSLLACNGTRIA